VDNIKIDLKEMIYEKRTEFIFSIGTGGWAHVNSYGLLAGQYDLLTLNNKCEFCEHGNEPTYSIKDGFP
jgi:hypothetical protein